LSSIAVIDAGGFLGQKLINHLINRGHSVYVFIRKNAEILIRNPKAVIGKDKSPERGFDIVFSLAYPSGGWESKSIEDNKAIIGMMQKLAGKNTRIIHTSTLAVFGFALELEQSPSLMKKRRDYKYVELNIDMECRLIRNFKKDNLVYF